MISFVLMVSKTKDGRVSMKGPKVEMEVVAGSRVGIEEVELCRVVGPKVSKREEREGLD